MCGRLEIDLFAMTKAIEPYMAKIKRSITVSVMGCVVNGPGEGAHADIGIAGGKRLILTRKGQVVKSMDEPRLWLPAIIEELEKIAAEDVPPGGWGLRQESLRPVRSRGGAGEFKTSG